MEQKPGKALAIVMHLLSKYKNKKDYSYHIFHVFMNNLFTTVPLLEVLDANGYHGTGCVRVNRLGKSCPLADSADFKRTERGSMRNVKTIIASSADTVVGQWHGNPSFLSIWNKPTVKLKKVVKNTEKNVNIPIPKAVREYNLGVGGTDRMEQNINA